MYTEYIIQNYDMLYELVGLAVLLEISAHLSSRLRRLTRTIVLLLLAESLLFSLEQWTQSFPQLSLARPLLTASLYSIYPVVLVVLMFITAPEQRTRWKLLLLLTPWLLSLPLFYSSQWTHLVCWFTEENKYQGGPLSSWPYLLFGLYSLVFLIQNLLYFRRAPRINRVAAWFIVLGPLLGAALYMIFEVEQDYSAMFTSAILLYYVFFYIHLAKIDPLTGLLNRQGYYQDLSTDEKDITGVISVDMNELKYLNDNFGHEAGDKALKVIGDVLKKDCAKGGVVYRVGGDEFVIVCHRLSEEAHRTMIENMRESFAKTPYTCAFGYAMRSPGESIDAVLSAADAKMFEDKAAFKNEILTRGGTPHFRD